MCGKEVNSSSDASATKSPGSKISSSCCGASCKCGSACACKSCNTTKL